MTNQEKMMESLTDEETDVLRTEVANTCQDLNTVQFTKCDEFPTFSAEYTYREYEQDLLLHFFLPKETSRYSKYWLTDFPAMLSEVAQDVLNQGYPELYAGYAGELFSWWLISTRKAPIDLTGLVQNLLSALDGALKPFWEAEHHREDMSNDIGG